MKKILGISLCALFAVSAANANIASQEYVDQRADFLDSQITNMDLAQTGGQYVSVVSQTNGKVSATGKSFEGTLNAGTQDNAPTSAAVANHVKGAIDALDVTAIQGDYIKAVSQADGKVSATAESFATDVATGGDNAPKSSAVASYVQGQVQAATPNIITGTDNGTISVNGTDVAVAGLNDLAYKATITNADVAEGAAIDTDKIAFSTQQSAALNSGIDSTKVGQINTNAVNIGKNLESITTNSQGVAANKESITNLTTKVNTNEGAIATNTQAIAGMDFGPTTGDYVTVVSQADGKVSATGASFAGNVAEGGTNAPTSAAVVSYVTSQVQAATPEIDTGSANGTISVNDTDVAVAGLQAMAYKASVATGDIDNGTIVNDDISNSARIASTKIEFTDAQNTVFGSGITSNLVADIGTTRDNLAAMLHPDTGYDDCKTSENGCALVVRNGAFVWEEVRRADQ